MCPDHLIVPPGGLTSNACARCINVAVDEERIARNPAARVPASRIEQAEPWVLTPDEVERVADEVGERWRALVLLAAYSSLRWSELVALRVSRLDLIRRRLRVEEKIVEHGRLIAGEPKTRQSRRSVPSRNQSSSRLPSTFADSLPARMGSCSWLRKAGLFAGLTSAMRSGDQRSSAPASRGFGSGTSGTPALPSPPARVVHGQDGTETGRTRCPRPQWRLETRPDLLFLSRSPNGI